MWNQFPRSGWLENYTQLFLANIAKRYLSFKFANVRTLSAFVLTLNKIGGLI